VLVDSLGDEGLEEVGRVDAFVKAGGIELRLAEGAVEGDAEKGCSLNLEDFGGGG